MKTVLLTAAVAAAAAAAAVAAPANAFTFFSVGATTGAAPGDPGLAAYETSVVSFDGPSYPGVVDTTSGNVALYSGTTAGVAAAPTGDTSTYQAIGTGGKSVFDFTGVTMTQSIKSVSVYVGSVDAYNYIDVLDKNLNVIGTISGSQLPGDSGDQGASITNRRLYISAAAGETIGGLAFRSDGVAFEFDTIGASHASYPNVPNGGTPATLPAAVVPEPASWALMVGGFGLVGFAARRRRVAVVAA